ncbi:MAG: nucleotide exchange factor GrpE [Verrucomicrobia bacterium]|nr:nucleotide exchange factor GrpE [Verrucomicrobiota bacterium]
MIDDFSTDGTREILQEKIDHLQDKLLRQLAETENIRTRSAKLIEEAKDYAIQEQTAGQVPVQPTTTVGEEVVQGEPTTESQVLTEEGKAEWEKSGISRKWSCQSGMCGGVGSVGLCHDGF